MGIKNGDAITASYSTTATPASPVGTYDISARSVATDAVLANYAVKLVKGRLSVTPPPLLVAGLSGVVFSDLNYDGIQEVGESGIASVTVKLTGTDTFGHAVSLTTTTNSTGQYSFTGLVPSNSAGYTVTETAPSGYFHEGQTAGSTGGTTGDRTITTVLNSGANSVANTFAEVKNGSALASGQTATIGFWHNGNGQSLINSLNGGSTATNLATWLATEFPNLYGSGPAYNSSTGQGRNLTGQTNAGVAAMFLTLFKASGTKTEAQVLGTALAVYVTNPFLNNSTAGQSQAQKFGFDLTNPVSAGAATFNVGSSGAAFGVANNTILSVYQFLLAANKQSSKGSLYNGNATNLGLANTVFNNINTLGDITG